MPVTLLRLLLAQVLIAGSAFGFSLWNCKFLDLTHTLEKGIPHWGDIDFEFTQLVRGPWENVKYLEANKIGMNEHFGTHVDAPAHVYLRPRQRIDQIPLHKVVGPACVFDVSKKVKDSGNDDYGLTMEDVKDWEKANGKMPRNCIALMYSGWEFRWNNASDYLGTATNDLADMHYPGFGAEAGEYLAGVRKVKAVGTDTLSLDTGDAARLKVPYPVHYSVLGRNLLGYENLNNLHLLPPYGATVAMLPMKVKEGSGGPIRAFAIGWNGENDPCRVKKGPDAGDDGNDESFT